MVFVDLIIIWIKLLDYCERGRLLLSKLYKGLLGGYLDKKIVWYGL